MKYLFALLSIVLLSGLQAQAQVEPSAGTWRTWFIHSGRDYRLPPPPANKKEISKVLELQQHIDDSLAQQIIYWNTGGTGYRWRQLMNKLWITDTGNNPMLSNMLLNVTMYDATIAAWDTKYAYNRVRPWVADKSIKAFTPEPESPSYPCEYSVAAGVAVTIISHFFPAMEDSVVHMAEQLMYTRVAAGMAFPSDTAAGFELGRRIAEREINQTWNYPDVTSADSKVPEGPMVWKGKHPMFPLAGHNKTVVLDSASQLRPGPPPDYTKDMAELKNFKPTFSSMSNAFFWANGDFWSDVLDKEIFEHNLNLNPPRDTRLHALCAIGLYDAFTACWDAKYTYWGIRPNQYDTTYRPPLLVTPPFPGYPSGHATISGVMAGLYGYFFPSEKSYFEKKAEQAAESRFQAGIHFRTDNVVGLDMGRKIAALIVTRAKTDGADKNRIIPDYQHPAR